MIASLLKEIAQGKVGWRGEVSYARENSTPPLFFLKICIYAYSTYDQKCSGCYPKLISVHLISLETGGELVINL